MTPLFKKLNFKNQASILVINHPESLEHELLEMAQETNIVKSFDGLKEIEFAIIFTTTQEQVNQYSDSVYHLLKGDAILWFCYPKQTSKKYKCDFNRDTGWTKLIEYNFDTVRMVAIDEDWSAMRFRKSEYVKR